MKFFPSQSTAGFKTLKSRDSHRGLPQKHIADLHRVTWGTKIAIPEQVLKKDALQRCAFSPETARKERANA